MPKSSAKTSFASNSSGMRLDHRFLPGGLNRKRDHPRDTLERVENEEADARLQRATETQERNQHAQNWPEQPKRRKRCPSSNQEQDNLDTDVEAFLAEIDEPLLRICGSCGELVKAARTIRKQYQPEGHYMAPLRNADGICEIIQEAITTSEDGVHHVFFCCRCNSALLKNDTPKFCRASGFRIAPVPTELAVLNWMESRLIGLGISFTTCINLYRDQQEFTRGNAVNYWNDVHEMTLLLPRPLSKSGVVLLRSKNDNGESIVRVRPALIRQALGWLIVHNPLYEKVCISEEVLADLERLNKVDSVLSVEITAEEISDLQNTVCRDGPREGNYDILPTPTETESVSASTCHASSTISVREVDHTDIDIEDSFELQADRGEGQTEAEKIIEAANAAAGQTLYPTGELRCSADPINEYTTSMLMQNCFPTLFPNGQGGYNPLPLGEERIQEYALADYCAHLMKWHDRRFVIHRNFKFLCLNLIQRRQIDGLVRRISLPDHSTRQADLQGGSEGVNNEVNAAMDLLDALKPYFRSVRGTGLYWANVRDDVMSMLGNRVLTTRWPTFFLTLSAADTVWPDFFRACDPAITLEEARTLSSKQRRRFLIENPDIAARHFNRRFKSFFDHIICGKGRPLGDITDYFWRVEFQQRGSPHIHALLWVRDAPDILRLSESEAGRVKLAKYVDSVMSVLSKTAKELEACNCSVCSIENDQNLDILSARPPKCSKDEWQCDLSRLVQRVQQHVCTPSSKCRKQSNVCRFGYPKELRKQTQVEVNKSVEGIPSVQLYLKRDVPTINNYSPSLLSAWRANMDIQLVGNAYGAAEYTAAYVSKAEPDSLRFKKVITAALKRCDPNLPSYAILKRVANASLSIREVSAQEAYFILLRELPLYGKSRQVTRVKVKRHTQRYYRVESSEWDALNCGRVQDTEIRIESVESAYMARPFEEPFTNMSYASFVENYEVVSQVSKSRLNSSHWKLVGMNGFIRLRSKSHVVRGTPGAVPDSTNPHFCFAEIFLHKPWRDISELPETDEECLDAFALEQENRLQTEILQESSALLSRQEGIDALKGDSDHNCVSALPSSDYVFVEPTIEDSSEAMVDIRAGSTRDENDNACQAASWVSHRRYDENDIEKARGFIKNYVKPWVKLQREVNRVQSVVTGNTKRTSDYVYPVCSADDVTGGGDSIDESQMIPFALAMSQSRKRFYASVSNTSCEPMHLIIHGEGGSGKSWLIRHIVKDVHRVFGEHAVSRQNSKRVLLLAHQGTAAFNIKGRTICSALELTSFSRNSFSSNYASLTTLKGGQAKLKRLQDEHADVHLVIIDEFSVISCGMLYWIDQRMREIWPKFHHLAFGGRDIIFTGDLAQLDPVVPYSLSTPLSKLRNPSQRLGRTIWENIRNVCNLTSQNRGKTDPEWFSALRRLRCKHPTTEDVAMFNSRVCTEKEMPAWASTAKHIAYMNTEVSKANDRSIVANPSPILHVRSKHSVQLKRLAKQRPVTQTTIEALLQEAEVANSSRDRVIGTFVKLAVGAPVTLTFNMAQSAGLCNGTNGIIYDFIFPSASELPIVLVQITDLYVGPSFLADIPNIVPIVPRKTSWSKKTSDLSVFREGIPVRLAYAMTVHKVQGLTCPKVVFHSSSIPNAAFAYVALSRVRSREDIVLTTPLTLAKLSTSREAISVFEIEASRIQEAVNRTKRETCQIVATMKQTALLHNESCRPR